MWSSYFNDHHISLVVTDPVKSFGLQTVALFPHTLQDEIERLRWHPANCISVNLAHKKKAPAQGQGQSS
jgi:hypothetical protein